MPRPGFTAPSDGALADCALQCPAHADRLHRIRIGGGRPRPFEQLPRADPLGLHRRTSIGAMHPGRHRRARRRPRLGEPAGVPAARRLPLALRRPPDRRPRQPRPPGQWPAGRPRHHRCAQPRGDGRRGGLDRPRRQDPKLSWAANWAGDFPAAVWAYLTWMYDDGYSSPNVDCATPSAQGCWGHRHDILARFSPGGTLEMGAADLNDNSYATDHRSEPAERRPCTTRTASRHRRRRPNRTPAALASRLRLTGSRSPMDAVDRTHP